MIEAATFVLSQTNIEPMTASHRT